MMLDLLAANPYVTVKGAAERMKVAFTTAQRAVDRLQKPAFFHKSATRNATGSTAPGPSWKSWRNRPDLCPW